MGGMGASPPAAAQRLPRPLSAQQQELYASFQKGLSLCDKTLEAQLRSQLDSGSAQQQQLEDEKALP